MKKNFRKISFHYFNVEPLIDLCPSLSVSVLGSVTYSLSGLTYRLIFSRPFSRGTPISRSMWRPHLHQGQYDSTNNHQCVWINQSLACTTPWLLGPIPLVAMSLPYNRWSSVKWNEWLGSILGHMITIPRGVGIPYQVPTGINPLLRCSVSVQTNV